MGFFKRFRSTPKSQQELQQYPIRRIGVDYTTKLDVKLLCKVLRFVCPHTADDSYLSSETSLGGDNCPSCGSNDLFACSLVSRAWSRAAAELLYHSIRIDPVHFCPYGAVLSEQRKRKRIDPVTVPTRRLKHLESTLHASSELASRVQIIKLSHTTRETAGAILTRLVSSLHWLRYVDLPEGFYKADRASLILRHEVQASCPDLRKMTYRTGAEQMFAMHLDGIVWSKLQIVELDGLALGTTIFRTALGNLQALRELSITHTTTLDDDAFESSQALSELPALEKLTLEETPNISAQAILAFLSRAQTQQALTQLTLVDTGVACDAIHAIVERGLNLKHLSVQSCVKESRRLDTTPLLANQTLETLGWEITSSEVESPLVTHGIKPTDSYYNYLAASLQAHTMPRLQKVYVRDSEFPRTLLSPQSSPRPSTQRSPSLTPRSTLANGNQSRMPLEVYAKGPEDLDWVTCVAPIVPRDSIPGDPLGQRIQASLAANGSLRPRWRGEARKSIFVLDGRSGSLIPGLPS